MTVQWWSRIKSQPVVRTALKIVLVVFILCVAFVAAFLVVKKIESSSSSKTQITKRKLRAHLWNSGSMK